jgi:hypothetical protein
VFCNDSGTNPTTPAVTCDTLTILYPVGGEMFKVGSTYQIKWCLPSNWPYTQTRISLSVSNTHFANFSKDLVSNLPSSNLSFSWTVDSTQIGDSCKMRISDYEENKKVYSGYFRIER